MNIRIKNLLSLAIAVISSQAAIAQAIEVQGSKIQNFYPESAGFTDCSIYMKNIGTGSLKIAYEKVSADYPAGWDVSFCDNRNCFFSFRDRDTFTAMAPGEKASMKITVFPKGNADTAIVKYAVWDVNNPSVKDTLTFNIMVRWSAGNYLSCMPQQAIFPVPANRYLQVYTSTVAVVEIRSLSGQIISCTYPVSDWTRLDIEGLTAGSYVVLLKGSNGSRSYTFLKD